jgi:hypothetical protein
MEICDAMQKIAVEFRGYRYRRMTAGAAEDQALTSTKRVLRMMREANLPCVRRRKFMVTTDSRYNLPVHPNLVGQMVTKATRH